MRVPSLDVLGQAPGPRTRSAQPMLVRPTSVGRDVQQAGAAIAQGAGQLGQLIGRAQAEADEIEVAEKMTALERLQTRAFYGDPEAKTEGFLSRKGKAASEASSPLMEELEKERQALADSLANPRQRNAFSRRSHGMLADSERRAFAHVASEVQRAKMEALESMKQEALAAITNAPPGPIEEESVQRRVLEVAETVGRLNTGNEERELKQWEAEVAAARISGDLQRHDVTSAKARLEATKEKLEPLGPKALQGIRHQVEVASMRALAEETVGGVLQEATKDNVDGFVSEEKAAGALEKRMSEVPLEYRPRVRSLFNAQLALAAKAEREKRDTAKKDSFRLVDNGGMHALTEELRGFLERNEPEYLARLERTDAAKAKRAKALARGGEGGAAARREQSRQNRLAMKYLRAMDPEERAKMDVEAVLSAPELEALGVDHVDDEGRLELKALLQSSKTRADKGLGSQEKAFVSLAESAWRPYFAGKKSKYKPEDKLLLKAAAAQWFEEFTQKNDRPPTMEEQTAQAGKMASSIPALLEEAKGMEAARANRAASSRAAPRAPAPTPTGPVDPRVTAAEAWLSANPTHPQAAKVRAKLEALKGR